MNAVNIKERTSANPLFKDCDIPGWLEMLVKKCLEKLPENRFKTGRELSQFYYDGLEGKLKAGKSYCRRSDRYGSVGTTALLQGLPGR